MPFVAVPDKNSGDVFTTAMWTTYLEGNLNGGVDRPLYDSGVLAVAAGSIDILSIPQTFAALRLVIHARVDAVAASTLASLRFNNDSTAAYHVQRLSGNGAAASAGETLAQTLMAVGDLPAASAAAGIGGSIVVWIAGYSTTALSKAIKASNACPTGSATTNIFVEERAGFWNNTSAISRITVTPSSGNFVAGSRFTLTGLAYI